MNELTIGPKQASVASSAGNDGRGAHNRIAVVANYVPRRCPSASLSTTILEKKTEPDAKAKKFQQQA